MDENELFTNNVRSYKKRLRRIFNATVCIPGMRPVGADDIPFHGDQGRLVFPERSGGGAAEENKQVFARLDLRFKDKT